MSIPPPLQLSRRQLIAGAAGLAGASGLAETAAARTAAKPATFVLVHGAWHGGWCWRGVADRLSARGHYVVAPTLSGVGERAHLASDAINLTTQINDVIGEIRWKDLDRVVLVGHSYGGMVITGVAEQLHERIAALVYLDAFLPTDGQSAGDVLGGATWTERLVPPISATAFGVNAHDRAWVDAKMTPHPVGCFTEKLKVSGAYQQVAKKLYVRASGFANPAFDSALARCRADQRWQTRVMNCGHDIMVDQPAELSALLERLA
jgi:pimeloyl-ACP methyl ester carboxylesterase